MTNDHANIIKKIGLQNEVKHFSIPACDIKWFHYQTQTRMKIQIQAQIQAQIQTKAQMQTQTHRIYVIDTCKWTTTETESKQA